MVTFDRIWHIFPPGQLVLTTFYGLEAACRITKCKEGHIGDMKVWNVSMEYVDWNGNSCGYAPTTATIQGFQKTRRVTSLPIYPLSFHPEKSAVEARLLARGRHFESLRGYQFQSCVGTKIMLEGVSEERLVSVFHSWRGPITIVLTRHDAQVSGRVIIDAHAYYHGNNIVKPKLLPLG